MDILKKVQTLNYYKVTYNQTQQYLKSDDDALRSTNVDNENTTSVAFLNKGEQIYVWTPTVGIKNTRPDCNT